MKKTLCRTRGISCYGSVLRRFFCFRCDRGEISSKATRLLTLDILKKTALTAILDKISARSVACSPILSVLFCPFRRFVIKFPFPQLPATFTNQGCSETGFILFASLPANLCTLYSKLQGIEFVEFTMAMAEDAASVLEQFIQDGNPPFGLKSLIQCLLCLSSGEPAC